MIKVAFETAIFIYLLITVFGLLSVWVLFTRIRMSTKNVIQMESIWQCSICTYIYVDSRNKKFSLCPRCDSYNERNNSPAKDS